MKAIAKAMQALKLDFDLILSSPFVRARRTAEIVAETLELKKSLEFSDFLRSGASNERLVQELQTKYSGKKTVLLAGHEPNLSNLLSVLLTGKEEMTIDLKKGGFCKVVTDRLQYGRCAVLKWLLTPRQMTKISQK
jgi:phosphohistidine phosphatase